MKKFGTPIGAGPGSENEKVGLLANGTPAPVGPLGVVGFFLVLAARGRGRRLLGARGALLLAALVGRGPVGFVAELVVDVGEPLLEELLLAVDPLEDEPEVEVEPLLDEVGVDEVVVDELVVEVVVVVVVLVPAAGAQDSLSDTTVPVIGRPRLEIGVPGEALTLKVYVWPPRTVTVTVQASAEALPKPIAPSTTRVAAVTASTNSSFPLISSPRTNPRPKSKLWAQLSTNSSSGDCAETLLTSPTLCNAEPTLARQYPFEPLFTREIWRLLPSRPRSVFRTAKKPLDHQV